MRFLIAPRSLLLALCMLLTAALVACSASESDDDDSQGVAGQPIGALTELVAGAEEGATVFVPAGTYREQLEITKAVTIRPEGDGAVIIDGECQRNNGIHVLTGSGIQISGITIRNTISAGVLIGQGPENTPLPSKVMLHDLTITDFDCQNGDAQYNAGIAVWNAACCMAIVDNTITYRTTGDVKGNGNGIWFKSNTEIPSGGRHYIAHNTIVGGWDGIGGETEGDPHGTFDGDTIVTENHIRDCWDDGIQVEGGARNVRVTQNEITGCGTGIAFAAAVTGPLTVMRNYIHDLEIGLYENLFCYKIGNEGEGVVRLLYNICRTEGDGMLQTNPGITPLVMYGNCFDVTRYVISIDVPGGASSFDADVMWTSDPDRFIEWGTVRYDSLGAFQEGTGFEVNGLESQDCPLGE